MGTLGIQVVYDLRTERERTSAPWLWSGTPTPSIVEAAEADAEHGSMIQQIELAVTEGPARLREAMLETYRALPAAFAGTAGRVAGDIAGGRCPVLVACRAGKDRTGFVCAAVLLAAGVKYDTVMEDYLASNEFFGPQRIGQAIMQQFGRPVSEETLRAAGVDREYLDEAVSVVTRDHGSLDAFIAVAMGLSDDSRARLADRLLNPAD
jgi:protein-tyrosine phosphatase